MLVEHVDRGSEGGGPEFEFAFVHVLEDVLRAVVKIKIPLPVGTQSHHGRPWFQRLQRSDVHTGTPASKLMHIVRVKQRFPRLDERCGFVACIDAESPRDKPPASDSSAAMYRKLVIVWSSWARAA